MNDEDITLHRLSAQFAVQSAGEEEGVVGEMGQQTQDAALAPAR